MMAESAVRSLSEAKQSILQLGEMKDGLLRRKGSSQ
jgi:hypothetical protein